MPSPRDSRLASPMALDWVNGMVHPSVPATIPIRCRRSGWLVVIGLVTAACGEGDTTTSPPPQQTPVVSVSVEPSTLTLAVGQTGNLTAAARDASGAALPGRTITWSTSDPTIATTSSAGVVTATAPGAATIIASCEGKSGGASITVAPVPVASVTVTPSAPTVAAGASLQLSAVTLDAGGSPLSGRTVSWMSGSPAVATVSPTGLVSAVGPGTTTITAASEGKSGEANVTVIPVPVASVVITLERSSLPVGQTLQASATPTDAQGNALASRVVTWGTSDATIATVSTSGLVAGIADGGPVTITATSESVAASAQLLVGCRTTLTLEVGGYAVPREPVTDGCVVELVAGGDYVAVPFIPESGRSPDVSSYLDLPHTIIRLDLAGGGPTVAGSISQTGPESPARVRTSGRAAQFEQQAPDLERRMVERSWTTPASIQPCASLTMGARIPVPTERYDATNGQFAGHVRNVFAGPIESWRVALLTPAAVVVVDSVFWSRLPSLPAEQQALATLARAMEQSVLPTMARFGMVPRDLDGDGRVLVLVPLIPFPSNALAASLDLGSLCPGVMGEAVVIPSSRYESSPEFQERASMADAASTLMHELTHLAQSYVSPTTWYNMEGMARLAEHVWRLGTTTGSAFATHLSSLPLGSFEGQVGLSHTGTASPVTKHCIDPSLEGLDYRRLPGNIRAYDRACWALARLAANLVQRGASDASVFPSLLAIANQTRMDPMWNEVTGENRTADEFAARWLAGTILEELQVAPRDASLRDPIWDIAGLVGNPVYAWDSRLRLAPTMDASHMTATLDIVDESAMMARVHTRDRSALRIGLPGGGPLGSLSQVRLLLVRLR